MNALAAPEAYPEAIRPPISTVAVVIPAHRAAATVAACVESVLGSTRPPERVIVVDDASTDATFEIVSGLAATHGPRVAVIRCETNRGPAAARNAGARAAGTDAVFFLDSDTRLEPEAMECFLARLAQCDGVSGVYGPDPLNPGAVPRYKALLDHFNFTRRGAVDYDGFSGYCAGVRTSAFLAVDGFDETLRAGDDYENEDFGYRLAGRGYRMMLDPHVQARHHFPGFGKLTRVYFHRVSQWVGLFLSRRRFESAGDATAGTGVATLALPASLCLTMAALVWPPASWLAVAFFGQWLFGYGPFFLWVLRRWPAHLPACLHLNVWFCFVISAGAAWGALRFVAFSPPQRPGAGAGAAP